VTMPFLTLKLWTVLSPTPCWELPSLDMFRVNELIS
jgi:hypothetical protein